MKVKRKLILIHDKLSTYSQNIIITKNGNIFLFITYYKKATGRGMQKKSELFF